MAQNVNGDVYLDELEAELATTFGHQPEKVEEGVWFISQPTDPDGVVLEIEAAVELEQANAKGHTEPDVP